MKTTKKQEKKRKRSRSWLDQIGRETKSLDERADKQPTHLAPVYVLLLLIVVLAVVATLVWSDIELVARFGPNLASEALGILLTVVFVRRFMEQAERSRRLRASIGALRKARRALQDLVETWTTTLKGCLQERERGQLTRAQQLLAPDTSELLMWCDPQRRRPGGDHERWVAWMGHRLTEVQAALDQIVGTWGGTLDPDYVESLDALIEDQFLKGFANLTTDETIEPQRWRVALNTARALRMAHFERLLRAIDLHNRLAAEVATVRGRSAAPRSSTLGVELPPDYDLRVDTVLDDGWWRSPPNVGALRMTRPET